MNSSSQNVTRLLAVLRDLDKSLDLDLEALSDFDLAYLCSSLSHVSDLLSEEYRYRFECVYEEVGREPYKFYVMLYEHDVSSSKRATDNVTYFL